MSEIFAVTRDIESIADEAVMVVETGDYVIVHQTSTNLTTLVDGAQHESKARRDLCAPSKHRRQLASSHRSRILALSGRARSADRPAGESAASGNLCSRDGFGKTGIMGS